MATRITCPNCRRLLLLPADCTAEVLSCPRCLTPIDNPQAAEAPISLPTEAPPAREPSVTAAPLPSPVVPPRIAEVDADVGRDNRGTGRRMIFLAVLGGVGISYALLGSFALLGQGEWWQALVVLSALMVLTLFSTVWVIASESDTTIGGNLGRIVLRVLTISGAIVAVGVLLAIASLILLFVVCLSSGGKC